jgi:hypothetical protein
VIGVTSCILIGYRVRACACWLLRIFDERGSE